MSSKLYACKNLLNVLFRNNCQTFFHSYPVYNSCRLLSSATYHSNLLAQQQCSVKHYSGVQQHGVHSGLGSRACRSRTITTSSSMSVTCNQLIMDDYGDPEKVVKMKSIQLPSLKTGQVLVKMLAAPVNPSDINTIQGTYAIKPDLPCVLGNEGVAEVMETSAGDSGPLQVGDWVIPSANAWGTWRSHAIASHDDFIKLPAGLTTVAAATLAINPCTAHRMLKDFVPLQPGDCVIQNGANSAVGRAVVQLCAHYGYKSINLVRDRPNIAELKADLTALGADVVITEKELRTNERVAALPKPRLALNCVSGKLGTTVLHSLTEGGVMVTYGGMSRKPVTLSVGSLIFNDVSLVGYWQTRWIRDPANKAARLHMMDELCELIKLGKLQPPPHKLVPFSDYKAAISDAMSSDGKVGAKQILAFD